MAQSKPQIALLSLAKEGFLDETAASLFSALKEKANVTSVETKQAADDLFNSTSKPAAILATDAALTTKAFRKQRDAAIKYVREDGGTLIFCCHFSSFARPSDIKDLFHAFGLAWQSGDYHRTEFSVNNANDSVPRKESLAQRYSQKALHLQNVVSRDAVYLPTASSYTQSAVFPPGPVGDRRQSPTVLGTCRAGKVGYIGDVNSEAETDGVVLAMCGLL